MTIVETLDLEKLMVPLLKSLLAGIKPHKKFSENLLGGDPYETLGPL